MSTMCASHRYALTGLVGHRSPIRLFCLAFGKGIRAAMACCAILGLLLCRERHGCCDSSRSICACDTFERLWMVGKRRQIGRDGWQSERFVRGDKRKVGAVHLVVRRTYPYLHGLDSSFARYRTSCWQRGLFRAGQGGGGARGQEQEYSYGMYDRAQRA